MSVHFQFKSGSTLLFEEVYEFADDQAKDRVLNALRSVLGSRVYAQRVQGRVRARPFDTAAVATWLEQRGTPADGLARLREMGAALDASARRKTPQPSWSGMGVPSRPTVLPSTPNPQTGVLVNFRVGQVLIGGTTWGFPDRQAMQAAFREWQAHVPGLVPSVVPQAEQVQPYDRGTLLNWLFQHPRYVPGGLKGLIQTATPAPTSASGPSPAAGPDLHGLLRDRFGLEAFKPGQEEAIRAALGGERLLLIQPTGWGKSLVYQMIAAVLRERASGMTVVFSPLKALMRDQVNRARQLGLRAEFINSDQGGDEGDQAKRKAREEAVHREILEQAVRREVDLLLIAPERLENAVWEEYQARLPIAALVVDEAHCISNWGHDFRPEYRRIVNVVRRLPSSVPVVAVTATATADVEREVLEQLGGGRVMRGPLGRQNLRLHVQPVGDEVERFAWVADWVARQEGTGIVYTATQAQTVELADFLNRQGIPARHYHGGMKEGRVEVEGEWMRNEVRVVVATNALGMGVDKPDVRFVVHAQFPGSPLNYYQEIGRAGRDGLPADVVLLFNPQDADIQKHFIQRSKPREEVYTRVMAQLEEGAYQQRALATAVDVDEGAVKQVLTNLMLQGAVSRDEQRFYRLLRRIPLADLHINAAHDRRLQELKVMRRYAQDTGCRMRFFTRFLGDSDTAPCGQCDRCLPREASTLPQELLQQAREVAEYPLLRLTNVEAKQLIYATGYASDYYGGTRTGELIHQTKYGGGSTFPQELVEQVVDLIRQRLPLTELSAVTFIPPTRSGDRVQVFAGEVAAALGLPLLDSLHKARVTSEQKDFTSREAKKANIKGAFQVREFSAVSGKNIVVIDDVCDNGITLAEAGRMLKRAGAGTLHAVTIAKTRLSDE